MKKKPSSQFWFSILAVAIPASIIVVGAFIAWYTQTQSVSFADTQVRPWIKDLLAERKQVVVDLEKRVERLETLHLGHSLSEEKD